MCVRIWRAVPSVSTSEPLGRIGEPQSQVFVVVTHPERIIASNNRDMIYFIAHTLERIAVMPLPNPTPDRDFLLLVFDYQPETGHLIYRTRPVNHFSSEAKCRAWNKKNAGRRAGFVRENYRCISIEGKAYPEHRVIWKMVNGADTLELIDHVNREGHDNRLSNLRIATHRENSYNVRRKRRGKSNLKGAIWHSGNKCWMSNIRMPSGERIHLGYYDTDKEAHAAYSAAAKIVAKGFACTSPS